MSPKEEFTSYFRAFLTQNHILYENDRIGTLIYKDNILHVILNHHIYTELTQHVSGPNFVKKLPVNSLVIGRAARFYYKIIWYYLRASTARARFRFLSSPKTEDKDYLPIFPEIDPDKNMFRKTSLGAIPSYNAGGYTNPGTSLHVVKCHQTTWGPYQPVLNIDDIPSPTPYYINIHQDQEFVKEFYIDTEAYVKKEITPEKISNILSKFGKYLEKK